MKYQWIRNENIVGKGLMVTVSKIQTIIWFNIISNFLSYMILLFNNESDPWCFELKIFTSLP